MNFWHQSPFVRILLPFVLGIVFESQARLHLPFLPWMSCCGFLLYLFFNRYWSAKIPFQKRYINGAIAYTLLFIFGMTLAQMRVEKHFDNHFSHTLHKDHTWVMRVLKEPIEKDRSIKAVVRMLATEDYLKAHSATGKMIVYMEKDSLSKAVFAGDRLVTKVRPSNVEPPTNPGQFNYKRYLYHQFIYQQVYLPSGKWTKLKYDGNKSIISYFEDLRNNLLKKLESHGIEGEEYAVLSALVLGKKDYLSHETHTAYASAGAMHVLAVSGLHVGLIYVVLLYLLGFLDKNPWTRRLQLTLLLAGIWLYALITGMSPSVMRASVMFSFIAIAKTSRLQSNIYNTLAASALALLIFNPFMIIEVGFQLSYLAVLGIVFLQPKIYALFNPQNKWIDKAWQLTAVSIAAQIATFPLGLHYFHQFPNYFFVSNLLVIPAATLLLYFTLFFFVISPIPIVSVVIGNLLNLLTRFLNFTIHQMEFLPHPVSHHISISVFETWLIYAVLISGIVALITRHAKSVLLHLGIWILLFSIQVEENYRHIQQHGIVIHDASGKTAISLVDGNECLFLYNQNLVDDEEAMLFHVQNFWDSRDIVDISHQSVDSLNLPNGAKLDKHIFHWKGKRLLFVTKELNNYDFSGKLNIDYALVADYWLEDITQIAQHFDIENLVFTNYHSKRHATKVENQASQNGMKIWNVREQGALVELN